MRCEPYRPDQLGVGGLHTRNGDGGDDSEEGEGRGALTGHVRRGRRMSGELGGRNVARYLPVGRVFFMNGVKLWVTCAAFGTRMIPDVGLLTEDLWGHMRCS